MFRFVLVALCLSLCLCGTAAASGVLHRGSGAEPETLDPHQATGLPEASILYDLYEGLLARGADGRPRPALAEAWEVAGDGLSVTFYLRRGVKWSDGTPITAHDVVFSFRRLADPASGSRNGNYIWPIKYGRSISEGRISDPTRLGVVAVDDMIVRFTLEEPTPYFIALLGYPMLAILPEAKLKAMGRDFFRPGNLVGAGGYRLVEAVPQSHVKLERNPHHRDAANIAIDTIYHHAVEDQETELKRFRTGALHATFTLPPAQLDWARANMGPSLRISPQLATYFMSPNLTREPWKSHPGLRRALSMVIDRDILTTRITKGGESPTFSYVPSSVGNYTPARPEWADWPMERRIATARQLLIEAGYPGGAGLELDILYNTAENHRRIAVALAAMFQQQLGIRTTLTNQEWKVFLDSRRSKTYQGLARTGMIGAYDDPNAFLEFLRSAMGAENPSGYVNRAFDATMAASSRETDPQRRRAMLQRAEQMLLDDTAIIPLFISNRLRLVDPKVRGWIANPMDANPSRFLSLDP